MTAESLDVIITEKEKKTQDLQLQYDEIVKGNFFFRSSNFLKKMTNKQIIR